MISDCVTRHALLDVMQKHWTDLGTVAEVRSVYGEHGVHSSNYVLTIERSWDTCLYLIKRVNRSLTERLENSMATQDWCHRLGAPVPRVIPRTDGGGLIACHGTSAYSIQEYCPGEAFQGTKGEIRGVASALANVNVVLKGIGASAPEPSLYHDLTPPTLCTIQNRLSGKSLSAFESLAYQVIGDLPSIYESFEMLKTCSISRIPKQTVHMDGHRGNVLFNDASKAILLDFDHVFSTQRMLSVAFACHRFAGFDLDMVGFFINTYHEIDKLDSLEVSLFPLFVAREAIRRVNYMLNMHFINSDSRWDFEMLRQTEIYRDAISRRGQFDHLVA